MLIKSDGMSINVILIFTAMIHNHKLVVRSDTLKTDKIKLKKEDVAFFK